MPSTTPTHERPTVPLALWPVGQISAQWQRAGRYHPDSRHHPAKMLPALAARIVAEYSSPGDLVVDPMAGIGTTLVEAAALGRRAVGVELEPRWAAVARRNLRSALDPEARRLATVRRGDARALPALLGSLAGAVDLVVVSPPYACEVGRIDKPGWLTGERLCAPDTLNYSADRSNLGHARGDRYSASMADVYTACARALRPGGLLVTVTMNRHRRDGALDLAGSTVELATQVGFGYLQHVIGLHAAVRDGELLARPSFWQLSRVRRALERGDRTHLVCHEDVCVFVNLAGGAR